MKICLSGANAFLDYLDGRSTLAEVLKHPAYQRVALHCLRYGGYPLTTAEVQKALAGQASPFYGLRDLQAHLGEVSSLMEIIENSREQWLDDAQDTLQQLLSQEDFGGITVYPIIGYDMGIGLDGAVCMNLNSPKYLANPSEMLYYIIHEAFHVAYERHHTIPPFAEMSSREDWLWVFHTMLQNEGFAVYTPLKLRQQRGDMDDPDYRVLSDPSLIGDHVRAFLEVHDWLEHGHNLERNEILEAIFGPKRLCYRVGCELIRRVEETHGGKAVQDAIYLDGNDFWQRYNCLLSR